MILTIDGLNAITGNTKYEERKLALLWGWLPLRASSDAVLIEAEED
tara:strand:- start:752 stop:889 length:138 start_codon:yes stop_codon:yes gene_type:complete